MSFRSDLNGEFVRRDEVDDQSSTGDPHEIFYRFGGKLIGYTGNDGTRDTDYYTSIADRGVVGGTSAFHNGKSSVATADQGDQLISAAPLRGTFFYGGFNRVRCFAH